MDFYYMDLSSPCRAVMLTAKAIGVKLNKKHVDLFKDEHMKPEFLALTPEHCVPFLVDGNLKLGESRAICKYLSQKYGDSVHYPKDFTEQAEIDRLLYFDMGTLYQRYADYCYPVAFEGQKEPDKAKKAKLSEALGWFNGYLNGRKFAAGDKMTIADFSLAASVATIQESGISLADYPNVTAWMTRCQTEMPGYDTENAKGAKECGSYAVKLNIPL